jgi:tetratricopeptide (TPR) repeat protein
MAAGTMDGDRTGTSLPPSVQAVLTARLAQLSPRARRLAQLAAVVGRAFNFEVLATVDGNEDELVQGLDELWQRRIIREQGEHYDFSHEYLRDVAYQEISRARRRLLHQRVAQALITIYAENLGAVIGQVAAHYELAGWTQQAILSYFSAAEKAQQVYAYETAIPYLQRLLTLLHDSPTDQAVQKQQLQACTQLGQICYDMGKLSEARTYLEQAVVSGRAVGLAPREMVNLYYKLGGVLFWHSDYDQQISIAEKGIALLGDDQESYEAAFMNSLIAWGYFPQGDREKAREYTLRNVQFIDRLPYIRELRAVYIHIIIVYAFVEKNLPEAMKWLDTFKQKAEECNDLSALGEVHYFSARIALETGDLETAISQTELAMSLFTQINDAKYNSWCLIMIGWIFLCLGDLQQARAYSQRGIDIAQSVGNEGYLAWAYENLSVVLLCIDAGDEAISAAHRALHLHARKVDYIHLAKNKVAINR